MADIRPTSAAYRDKSAIFADMADIRPTSAAYRDKSAIFAAVIIISTAVIIISTAVIIISTAVIIISICACSCGHVCARAYVFAYVCVWPMHVWARMRVRFRACVCVHACVGACVRACLRERIYVCMIIVLYYYCGAR